MKNLTKLQRKSLLYLYAARYTNKVPKFQDEKSQKLLEKHVKVFEELGWWDGVLTPTGRSFAEGLATLNSEEFSRAKFQFCTNQKYALSDILGEFLEAQKEVKEAQDHLLEKTIQAHHAMHQLVSLPFPNEWFAQEDWAYFNEVLLGELEVENE